MTSLFLLTDCYSANQVQTRSSTAVRSSTRTKGRSTKDTTYVLSPFKALHVLIFFSPVLVSSDNDVELMSVFFSCVSHWCTLNLCLPCPVNPMIFPLRNWRICLRREERAANCWSPLIQKRTLISIFIWHFFFVYSFHRDVKVKKTPVKQKNRRSEPLEINDDITATPPPSTSPVPMSPTSKRGKG